jgi:hypothetical protein
VGFLPELVTFSENTMSTAAPQPPMTPEQAYNVLYHRVHAPVFFNKLAAHGIQPRNAADAQQMLEVSGKLRTLYNASLAEKEAATSSGLSKMSQALDAKLAQLGLGSKPAKAATPVVTPQIQKAANDAALDTELAQASLVLLAVNQHTA